MNSVFPYSLPPSLSDYLTSFQSEPDKSIQRLESFLKRRGNDALGYLLLAFLHRENGNQNEALRNAQMASVFSPGSRRMHAAPYFFSHPDFFDAPLSRIFESGSFDGRNSGIALADLDTLIEQLTKPTSTRIEFSSDYENSADLSVHTLEQVDDIASETLASILVSQGKTTDALAMYRKLDRGTGIYTSVIQELETRLSN